MKLKDRLPLIFALACILTVLPSNGDSSVELRWRDSTCRVALRGGKVVSYVPDNSQEVIALGERGGIPVCWPWFVNTAPTNTLFFGLLYNEVWRVVESKESELLIDVVDSEATRAVWPHEFRASLHVRLDEKLALRVTVENRGSDVMTCRDGFHTFFKVGESLKCVVKGVDGLHYYYGVEPQFGYSRLLGGDFAVCRMKRGYVFAGGNRECRLVDPVLNRTITVGYVGNAKTIVWNGLENPRFSDVGHEFVCVEGANMEPEDAYVLRPGETHSFSMTIGVCPGEERNP